MMPARQRWKPGVQLDQNKPVGFFSPRDPFEPKKRQVFKAMATGGVGDPTFRPGDFSPRWLNTNSSYETLHIETNTLLFWGKKKQGETLLQVTVTMAVFAWINSFVHWEILLVPGGGIIHIWNSTESPPFTGSLEKIIDSTSLPF